jgi:hypothetical protein
MYLEIPDTEHGCVADGAHASCVIPRHESGWRNYRDWGRGRDIEVLECVSEEGEYRVEEGESVGLWAAYSMILSVRHTFSIKGLPRSPHTPVQVDRCSTSTISPT